MLTETKEITRSWNVHSGGGANGGFLLASELAAGVWDKARAIDGPLARCRFFKTIRGTFEVPAIEESSRQAGFRLGGIRARWQGTTDDAPLGPYASQPTVGMIQFVPKRVVVFSQPFSRNLLQDAEVAASVLEEAATQELVYETTDAMINGLGITHPLGVIKAPSTITVARATPNSISQSDIDGMWSRLWPYCRRNAVWMCNDDTLLKVDQAATTLGWPSNLYMPQGAYGNPYPLLKGRPLLPVEQCPALGSTGDLIVGDWSQYGLVARTMVGDATAPEIEVSAMTPLAAISTIWPSIIEKVASDQLYFDTDSVVWRIKLRVDGKPLWKKPVTIANGSQTAGPFVVLA